MQTLGQMPNLLNFLAQIPAKVIAMSVNCAKIVYSDTDNGVIFCESPSIDHSHTGNFDHAVGIIETLHLNQGNSRKMLPKYITINGP